MKCVDLNPGDEIVFERSAKDAASGESCAFPEVGFVECVVPERELVSIVLEENGLDFHQFIPFSHMISKACPPGYSKKMYEYGDPAELEGSAIPIEDYTGNVPVFIYMTGCAFENHFRILDWWVNEAETIFEIGEIVNPEFHFEQKYGVYRTSGRKIASMFYCEMPSREQIMVDFLDSDCLAEAERERQNIAHVATA